MSVHPSNKERLKLPKSIILRGIGVFGNIFKNGFYTNGNQVDARFLIKDTLPNGLYVGFVASKRNGNATVRNHQKRLLRETFRLNRRTLHDLAIDKNKRIELLLIAKKELSSFEPAQTDVCRHLTYVAQKL